jgi:hypothetical protein
MHIHTLTYQQLITIVHDITSMLVTAKEKVITRGELPIIVWHSYQVPFEW